MAGKQIRNNSFSCVFVILIMIFSSLASIGLVNNVEASASGNISINGSSPGDSSYIPAYEATYFTAELTNLDSEVSEPRSISWYVCLGEQVTNTCISQSLDDGSIVIPPMVAGETSNFTSLDAFYPNGLNETITVIYQFDEFDFNPTNDVLNFKLNSSLQFTDFKIETSENILQSLSNLANYDGEDLLSKDTVYNMTFSAFANICADCSLNASLGWQLWDENLSNMVSENYQFTENFPKLSFYRSFQASLPPFEHNMDGVYTLIYGLFDSSGDPYGDLYDDNNLHQTRIVINTELDISIDNMFPSHNPSDPNYYFGPDMISVVISNNGNSTATDFDIELSISKTSGQLETQFCEIAILVPNQQKTCVFDMLMHGDNVRLQASVPFVINNNADSYTPDNTIIEEGANVEVVQLSSYVTIADQKEWYNDNEDIVVTANVNPFSASPLNFSWWYSGVINVDYGQEITIQTSDYGLGSHTFKLISSDSLGNSEITYFTILVYSEISIDMHPYYTASATSPSNTVEIEHDSMLPLIRQNYNIGGGKTPLMLYQFDLVDTDTNNSIFDGQNWVDFELNLFNSIPSGVPYDSVEFRKLDSFADQNWEFFNPQHYGYKNQTIMFARLYEPTTILVIGDIGEPNIDARNFSIDLISAGNFELNWEPYGDINSDYILGWNIHQRVVPDFGGTIFQSPQDNYNELLWDDLLTDSFRAFVPLSETSW